MCECDRIPPRWERIHWHQLPIWVSSDAAKVVRWIRANCQEERRGGISSSRMHPLHASWHEIAKVVLCQDDWTLAKDDPRRLRVEEVVIELRESNILGDGGWLIYRLRPEIADVVVAPDPPIWFEVTHG